MRLPFFFGIRPSSSISRILLAYSQYIVVVFSAPIPICKLSALILLI